MLLQPFVENAIRHGLLPKKGKGTLKIQILKEQDQWLLIQITDDGIGMEQAGQRVKNSPFRFVSRGRELTLKRIQLMNETGYHIKLETISSEEGTTVNLKFFHKK
jgi:LytS/YehU family sensor histidine kinase